MYLGDLIKKLVSYDPDLVVANGFARPHSYRGYYDELAFEPQPNVTVKEMLEAARSALGSTYEGWKGGNYKMDEYTPCWISELGQSGGDQITESWLAASMSLARFKDPERRSKQLRELREKLEAEIVACDDVLSTYVDPLGSGGEG